MSEELKIECRWLGRKTGSPVDRNFYADIGLAVGDDWLTLLDDLEAHTVRNHLRGCAYSLGMWFAANWWRLRWEPETRYGWKDTDWRIAHSLASAGGGYVWPNVFFASDGDSLAVASLPRTKGAIFEPIRYLNRVHARITATEFERKIDAFMDGVLSRQHSLMIEGESLPELWSEVLAERCNVQAAQWRKLEAICGYDPDEAPAALLERLIADEAQLGINALEEVAAEARHSTNKVLNEILDLANLEAEPTVGGCRATMPKFDAPEQFEEDARPWQRAASLARLAREQWGLGKKPIKNEELAALLGVKSDIFTDQTKASTPMPIALQKGAKFDIYFNRSWSTSRRFATGRLLGDHLFFAGGRLIPATDARTSRQQFQRAFAQEFLCPFDALMEKIQTDRPDEEDIAEAANHFDVSPLMVRTTLVNKGELDREALTWAT